MKNNNDEYKINIEDKELKTEPNKSFSFFFELIDVIFVRYIKKIIKNEEKIYHYIFEKYTNQKKEFLNEQKEVTKDNNEVKKTLEKFKAALATKNQQIVTYENEMEKQRKQIKNLQQREQKIRNKKNTYLQDIEEHKNDLENQILINDNLEDKKAKKQYLNNMIVKIKNLEDDIKKKSNKVRDLKYNIKRDNIEIDIHTDKIKKNNEKIKKNELIFKKNGYEMVYEIKKLKEKWIKNISTDQQTFITFFKTINKFENIKFIECIEDYWERKKENIIVLNESFNVENNLQSIKEQNEKIGSELRTIFENLEINFKLKEEEIIENAIKETKEKFQEYWRKINESKLVSIETQTEINQKDEKTRWEEQKLKDQEQKIEQLQLQVDDLEKKLISIKREHEDEVNDLSQRLENIWKGFMKQNEATKKECERLKSSLDKKTKKTNKEQEIKDQLIVDEIKLTCIVEILELIRNEMPTLLPVISNDLIEANLDNIPASSSSTPKTNGSTC